MAGIDFADTIVVRRVVNKGTKIIEEPLKKSSAYLGDSFRNQELEKLKLAGDLMILSGKGTKKIRLSELATPKTPVLPKGFHITTGKGTGKMKIS